MTRSGIDLNTPSCGPSDTNGVEDVYVYRRTLQQTVDLASGAAWRDWADECGENMETVVWWATGGPSLNPSVSTDGTIVVWESPGRLAAGDHNNVTDIYGRYVSPVANYDYVGPQLMSLRSDGALANGPSRAPSVSGNGRYVAFASDASNLATTDLAGNADLDTNDASDVFRRDIDRGVTNRVSRRSAADPQPDGGSYRPTISADGTDISFSTDATNTDSRNYPEYDRDVLAWREISPTQTSLRLVTYDDERGHSRAASDDAATSDDGEYVAFVAAASAWGASPGIATLFDHHYESANEQPICVIEGAGVVAPLSAQYGGANSTLDTDQEVSAAIGGLSDASTRERRWPLFSNPDRVTMVSDEVYVAWGEEPPPADDATTVDFSDVVDVWDTEADPPEDPFPANETFAEWEIDDPFSQQSRALPVVIAVVGGLRAGCHAFCDDIIRHSGKIKPLFKRLKRTKKPKKRATNWRTRKADPRWASQAKSNPSRELRKNLGPPPADGTYAAHHIVAAGSRYARTAQKVISGCMRDIGIKPNSKANGVWIREDLHRGMHTQHYYNNVNRTIARQYYFGGLTSLTPAKRCERVKGALEIIKDALENGAFPY